MDYDLVVIGGGAAGLVAAREARRRKTRCLIVHEGPLGGECTFSGCVPSKALLAAAGRRASFAEAMVAVRSAIDTIAATENAEALRHDGIDTLAGHAQFTSPTSVDVDGRSIRSRRFVVATGSRPLLPSIRGLLEAAPLTNETLFDLAELPRTLAILGGGAIGCEMAQAFARLGSSVTIIEAAERLIAGEEPDASHVIEDVLCSEGLEVRTGVEAIGVESKPGAGTRVMTSAGAPVVADRLLVAVGRAPSGLGFGLEDLGVELDRRGAIVVDDSMATTVSGIWAAGDVTGRLQLTHAAGRMAWIAATNALAKVARLRPFRFDASMIPRAIFTSPEVGRVGLTEAEAAARHPGAKVADLPMALVDRAVVSGETAGFVRLIAAPRRVARHLGGGRLVGATVVAPTGGELIHEAAIAMQTGMFVGRLAQTTHAYPTWSMAIQLAALQFFGESLGRRARQARS